VAILHTNAEARALLDRLMQAGRMSLPREILIVNVTPAIGTHVGPDGLGFAAVTR
jgi:fatty acid-binding protein DegV